MNRKSIMRWSVFLTSLTMIGIGIQRQEPMEVLQKAVRICLECIGIG